jgi:hypothetical protein
MKKCKKCSSKSSVNGIEDIKYMTVAAAIIGGYATGMADKTATKNADGTAKDNYLANNPTVKNVLYLAAGLGVMAYLPGEMGEGLGAGIATYAGYQLIEGFMTKDPDAVNGMTFVPPRNIYGLQQYPGDYGIAPTNIYGTGIYDNVGNNYEKMEVEDMFTSNKQKVKAV